MMSRFLLPILLSIPACLAGCDRIKPEDKVFFEQREKERTAKESILRRANDVVTVTDVIERVRSHPVGDPEETTDAWLQKEITALKGQVMFPRWTTARRGSNKQEVTFSFVLIDASNQMQRLAYTWQVDVLDMTVGPPQLSKLAESASPDQSRSQQELRRVKEFERQLE